MVKVTGELILNLKQERLDWLVELGILGYYDISVFARMTRDELMAEARAIKDPDLRLDEFERIKRRRNY